MPPIHKPPTEPALPPLRAAEMALQSSASDPDGKPLSNTVFIDTNLDTHLATVVSDVDTVSDLKKRIMSEHTLCFPKIGQIQIHSIKVKRKGYYYHLSDSMFVRSAFNEFNKSWFLSVDASALGEHGKNQLSFSPGSSNQVACRGIANNLSIGAVDIPLSCPSKRVSDFNSFKLPQFENRQDEKEEVPYFRPGVSEHTVKVVKNLEMGVKPSDNDDTKIPSPGSIPERKDHCCVNDELPSSYIEFEVDGFIKANKDECNVYDEGTLKSVPSAKKKRKSIRKKEDTVQDDTFKERKASVLGPGKLTVQQDIIVPANPSEDAGREFSYGTRLGENNIADETEVPKELTKCNNNNTKDNINAECSNSMKEAPEPVSAANKKHRKRKRSLIHDKKEDKLKVDIASEKVEVHKSNEAQRKNEEPKEQVEFDNDKSGDGIEFQHNKVAQEASDTRSPAKKKQKGKERNRDESALKEKRSTISDSNKETLKPENASQHSMEEPLKIKSSNADQSTEYFDDTDPLRTSVPGLKRKKKNSSNHHQEAAVTFSRNHDEAEHSRIHGEGVLEEIPKDGQISKDINMSKISGDNMEIDTDACRGGIPSEVTRARNSKDHCIIDMNVHPDVNEPKELTEDNEDYIHENTILDPCHISEAVETEQAGEGRDISPTDGPKPMLSENCTPSNQNNKDAKREVSVTSKVLDASGTTEHGKSEKKRKKKRNAKDSGGVPPHREGLSGVGASESETFLVVPHKATSCDPTSGNTKTDENLLNQTDGDNVSTEKMKGTFLSATDREVDDINADNAVSLEKISKPDAHGENVSEKKRKKSKKKQTSTAKSESDMLTKEQFLDHKEPSPTSDGRTLAELSFKITEKNKSPSTKSTNKSSGPILDPEIDFIGVESLHSQAPSNALEGNYKVGPFGANDTAVESTRSSGAEDDNHLEAPSKSDKTNADQQFASRQQQNKDILSDDMLVDEKNDGDRTNTELMTGKNKHRLEATKGNTPPGSLSSMQQLLSNDENDGVGINPGKKVPQVHRSGQEAQLSSQSNSVTSTIEENRRPQVIKASGKSMNSEKKAKPIPVSNSKLKGFKKGVQNKVGKASGNNIGAVSNTQQKTSLLAGAIFKDDSSDASEDENKKADDSNSSTRTPSDNSLSSDCSDGDSNAGSYGGKRLENGEKSSIKAHLSGSKGMTIDRVLRSSTRYKNAKMMASQLRETESQPIDSVPDSLAD